MVWVRTTEKFHGKMIPYIFWKKHKNLAAAKLEQRKWNSVNEHDSIKYLAYSEAKPTGLLKTAHAGIAREPKNWQKIKPIKR